MEELEYWKNWSFACVLILQNMFEMFKSSAENQNKSCLFFKCSIILSFFFFHMLDKNCIKCIFHMDNHIEYCHISGNNNKMIWDNMKRLQ